MGDIGVINHTIYVSNLNEKIKKPLLKKSLHRWAILRSPPRSEYIWVLKYLYFEVSKYLTAVDSCSPVLPQWETRYKHKQHEQGSILSQDLPDCMARRSKKKCYSETSTLVFLLEPSALNSARRK